MPAWDKCDRIVREYDEETRRELVLICDLQRHEAPGDSDEVHHDPRFGVFWKLDEDGPRFDDDE